MFMENLPKKGPLFREFLAQNPPIWAAHTRTLNMLCYPPSGDSGEVEVFSAKRLEQRSREDLIESATLFRDAQVMKLDTCPLGLVWLQVQSQGLVQCLITPSAHVGRWKA